MNFRKLIRLFLLLSFILTLSTPVSSEPLVRITVKTILASQEGGGIDPGLRNIAKELQTVFKYSSYKLLGQHSLQLPLNTPGSVSLPGNRILKIIPSQISGDRAALSLEIYSRNRSIFQTAIKLRNNSSITVGGPKHAGGYLLFNIYNSF